MVSAAAEIESRVLQLSPSEQFDLYVRLRDKFDPLPEDDEAGVEAAWDAEIGRRLDEVESGRAVLVDSAEVEARMDALMASFRRPA